MSKPVASPRLVLVRPRNADNLVSIARAMQGAGVRDWVAVSTVAHFEGLHEVLRRHRAPTEVDALVAALRRVDTLAEAIADCSFVVGTSMRTLPGRESLSTRALAAQVARRGDSTWALVFGAESNGLQNADLEACHALSFIPSSAAQPSLNLSQAVVVYLHELASARGATAAGGAPLAGDALLRDLRAALTAGLREHGFPRRAAEELMAPLLRGALTVDEATRWIAAWTAAATPRPASGVPR